MDSLGGTLGEENVFNLRLGDAIHAGYVLRDALSHKRDSQGMSITASTDNFIQDSLGPRPGIRIDGFVSDEIGIENA